MNVEGAVVGRVEPSILRLWTEYDPDQVRVVEVSCMVVPAYVV